MQLLGIFGHPITHSLSPDMQNAALQETGLDQKYVYLPFDILPKHLEAAVASLPVLGARGVNITLPHKEKVLPLLDDLDPQALAIGAVNTVLHENGRLKGYNTDGLGFIRSLREEGQCDPYGKTILLLGAGGAARAIAAAMILQGAKEIMILNRTLPRAEPIQEMIQNMGGTSSIYDFSPEDLTEKIQSAQIIINTTSVGLYPPDQSLLAEYLDGLHGGQLVADIIYHPQETLLLKQAKEKGCATLSGLGMLIYQGAEAFRLWTGVEAPVWAMRASLEKKLKKIDTSGNE
ncbi:shikimate dehydrogenase [Dehalobacterium formicoaceticum]|uniref:Shikimate dehydrogenase (NADP(+)) n=1 Tax=Dehalobacterium formicoaceticum TaxID=51515 RepID=A0ABT1YAS6_9FIRM|nr:shikimate dehydrogenase [Dehalobacterium formicoaceticum]